MRSEFEHTGIFFPDAKRLCRVVAGTSMTVCLPRYALFADGKVSVREMPKVSLGSGTVSAYMSASGEVVLADRYDGFFSNGLVEQLRRCLSCFIKSMSHWLKSSSKPFFISFVSAFDGLEEKPSTPEEFLAATFQLTERHDPALEEWPYDTTDFQKIAAQPFALKQFEDLLSCFDGQQPQAMEQDLLKIESRRIIAAELQSCMNRFRGFFPTASSVTGRTATCTADTVVEKIAEQDWKAVEKELTSFYTANKIAGASAEKVKRYFDSNEVAVLKSAVSSYAKQYKRLGMPEPKLALADFKVVCGAMLA